MDVERDYYDKVVSLIASSCDAMCDALVIEVPGVDVPPMKENIVVDVKSAVQCSASLLIMGAKLVSFMNENAELAEKMPRREVDMFVEHRAVSAVLTALEFLADRKTSNSIDAFWERFSGVAISYAEVASMLSDLISSYLKAKRDGKLGDDEGPVPEGTAMDDIVSMLEKAKKGSFDDD